MTHSAPKFSSDPLYMLIREGYFEEFNRRRAQGEECSLEGLDLRGVDLRGLNVVGLDMRNVYMRLADLRGVDFRSANLEGASIGNAKISGCYFPIELTPEEIHLSLVYGTRMRYRK